MALATPVDFEHIIHEFFDYVDDKSINLYNEFSLQHELGIFLRVQSKDYLVEFERNASHFGFDNSKFEKKEIDIAIYDTVNKNLKAVLELKYPRNGQVPETIYSFCKDILFLEQLVSSGFQLGYFLALVDDKSFYSGKDFGIYSLFRVSKPITGKISKPTGKKDTAVHISGNYTARWQKTHGNKRYCLIKVGS